MASLKRTKLERRSEVEREGLRTAVSLPGTCRVGDRDPQEVHVLDLGPNGCRLHGLPVGVTKTDALLLDLGAGEPVSARLKWARKGAAGLTFEPALDQHRVAELGGIPAA
jgi:hypothetical protein